ncbi:MAG: serine/threonine-protein kinase [Sandaracinaceae bacterium]
MGNEYEDEWVGRIVDGRYEVLEQLGAGGMGLVYRARHVVLGREVAIKVLRPTAMGHSSAVQRAIREAQAASAIGDAHIVEVRDFGVMSGGHPYMVMELLRGVELADLIAHEAPLPVGRVCHIGAQIADALEAAHRCSIVHRDLKAENVILVPHPSTPDFVKLVDFGIAHVQNAESKITKAGEMLGTPQYMSPEQCFGQPVDHRADVYALGVLLYEMLTGSAPYTETNPRALLVAHMTSTPTPVGEQRGGLPPALEALVMRCLAKRPDARFASMRDVAIALRAVMNPPEAQSQVASTSSERQVFPRSRASARFAAGFALAFASAVVLSLGGAGAFALASHCEVTQAHAASLSAAFHAGD